MGTACSELPFMFFSMQIYLQLQHRAWQSCVADHARQRCSAEHQDEEEPRPYTSELAGCVRDTQHCTSQLAHLRHLTSRLPSLAALALSSPNCLLQNDRRVETITGLFEICAAAVG